MKTQTITLKELESAQCDNPECDHKDHSEIWIHPACHTHSGIDARYERGSGVLELRCHKCSKPIVNITVSLI